MLEFLMQVFATVIGLGVGIFCTSLYFLADSFKRKEDRGEHHTASGSSPSSGEAGDG